MFTHLHVHTEFSLLDGMCRIPRLLALAREQGMGAIAITDHGVLYGAIDFYTQAVEAGVKPILGCEMYLAQGSRNERNPREKAQAHLILLARDEEGYRNLLKLSTRSHLEGFYYKPRVDKELLAQHSRGLIALSACVKGEVPQLLLGGRESEARRAAQWYREVFGDFYLELQDHPIPELPELNRRLVALSRETGIPLVATNDVHYLRREDAPLQEMLLCIQTNTTLYDEKRLKMAGDTFYLRSPQEMAKLFSWAPEALAATQVIAEKCQLKLEFDRLHLPAVEIPPGKTPDEYLTELAWQGLRRRYPQPTPQQEERLRYELEVIRRTRFANYFLVVWDIISFTRSRGILFGVRGSAAASLVLYCLEVTDADPLAHRLVFERFLNLERKEMPDIDLDFQDDRRDEVIAYVSQKYGQDRVAQIITFGTLGARAVLRDVGRALGMPYPEVDKVARLVPFGVPSLAEALTANPDLQRSYQEDPAVRQLVDTAQGLEGLARHASTHAAGVVISQEPLTDFVPLQRPAKGEQGSAMTQFAMEAIARLGLLKMDFLGLVNLTILQKAREVIARARGLELDIYKIPLDDPKTFELLASGETTGLFQLEGGGMRRYIRELKPTTFGDIAAMVALYRPGPIQHISTFIRAKHGLEPVRYLHPALKDILEETYGVIVYQDQVLLIVQALAGYSLGEADAVRKAMGKKIPEVMHRERQRFIAGAVRRGVTEKVATEVFDLIEPFAGYAFNKAHSVSYAYIAYQTAYLKANFPAEYLCAVLTLRMGQQEKIAQAVAEGRRLGLKVLPPDINRSDLSFTIEKDPETSGQALRFGLGAIKNVGEQALRPILEVRRQGGPFKSIEDLCRRADLSGLNRRALESLIKVGALGSLGSRGALLAGAERILATARQEQRVRGTGQTTMFDLLGESVPVPLPRLELEGEEPLPGERLAWEEELLGVCLSEEHPFAAVSRQLSGYDIALCGQVDAEVAGQTVTVAGTVASVRTSFTRERRPFASALLKDLEGSVEVVAWPELYAETQELWAEGNILLVQGRVRVREDQVGINCQRVSLYQPGASPPGWLKPVKVVQKRLVIPFSPSDDSEDDRRRVRGIFDVVRKHPGEVPVRLLIDGQPPLDLPMIKDSSQVRDELAELVGERGTVLEESLG